MNKGAGNIKFWEETNRNIIANSKYYCSAGIVLNILILFASKMGLIHPYTDLYVMSRILSALSFVVILTIIYFFRKFSLRNIQYFYSAAWVLAMTPPAIGGAALFNTTGSYFSTLTGFVHVLIAFTTFIPFTKRIHTFSLIFSNIVFISIIYLLSRELTTEEILKFTGSLTTISIVLYFTASFLINLRVKEFEKREEINSLNRQLSKANATKDKFFAIIAHDLRNPIGALKGLTEHLNSHFDVLDEKDKKNIITDLKKGTGNLSELLENLLLWSRSQRGSINFCPAALDLFDIGVFTVYSQQIQALKKEINIENEIKPNTYVYADENMIKTVMRNLVSNAVKFTYEGGRIRLSANTNGSTITVSVRDNGRGIPKNIQKNLFSLDKTTSTTGTSSEPGTGLGLILCREFIENHSDNNGSGRIWVESEEGKGADFRFTLSKYDITPSEN